MKILKALARKILRQEMATMALVSFRANDKLALATQQVEDLKVDCFGLSQIINHHEARIRQMAPEKQFIIAAVDGTVLQQEMVYSSNGATRITVRLPLGHPWKQATELAQQLELANLTIDRAKEVIGGDPKLRRDFLGLDTDGQAKIEHHPV